MRSDLLAVGALLAVLFPSPAVAEQPPEKAPLTLIWHAGPRADLLLKLSQEYTRETGVEIKAILPPLTHEYYQRIAEEFAKKGTTFDLCIFDSQSMSEFASQGHILLLNDRLSRSGLLLISWSIGYEGFRPLRQGDLWDECEATEAAQS
jgi:hypothetical protein